MFRQPAQPLLMELPHHIHGKLASEHVVETVAQVQYDEHDARSLHLQTLRKQLAMVGQEPVLFNYSIRDNISYGYDSCTFEDIKKAAKIANIHDAIVSMPEVLAEF
ncbi:unnamed protein product [Anisakis simplex]|uniref:ABC transporter domain-containing protein n=1 Tax=Anisakis simplex TaxID=6269 RepID=A0A0M3JKW4_ANISI|nr:unnamed protein product [Anisakis simplex]